MYMEHPNGVRPYMGVWGKVKAIHGGVGEG